MGQFFHYESDGEEHGPVSAAELKQAAADGRLKPDDRVRKAGSDNWTPAAQVKGLFPDVHDRVRQAAGQVEKVATTTSKVAKATGKVADAVSDMGEAAGKLQKAVTTAAGLAAGGSTLAGSIGDFLRPLGNINLIVTGLALAAAGVLFALGRRKRLPRVRMKMKVGTVASLCVAGVFAAWTTLGAVAGKGDRGVLATNVPAIEKAQAAVVPVQQPVATRPAPVDEEKVGEVRRFQVPPALWTWTAFSPDGRRVMYCGLSPSLKDNPRNQNWAVEWEWGTGKELRRIALPSEKLGDASFSADRRLLLLASPDYGGPTLLWDVEAGREARRVDQPGMAFNRSTLCPDGLHAVRGGTAGNRVSPLVLVEIGTGVVSRQFAGAPDPGKAARLAVSPDDKLLYTSGAGLASRLWDMDTGKSLREFPFKQNGPARPAFTPDGRFVLHGNKGEVRPWDVRTGKEAGAFEGLEQYLSAAFSPDGRFLLTADLQLGDESPLRVWDVAGRKEVARLSGHTGHGPEGVDISPDGRYAVTSSQDGTVRVWRLPRAEVASAR